MIQSSEAQLEKLERGIGIGEAELESNEQNVESSTKVEKENEDEDCEDIFEYQSVFGTVQDQRAAAATVGQGIGFCKQLMMTNMNFGRKLEPAVEVIDNSDDLELNEADARFKEMLLELANDDANSSSKKVSISFENLRFAVTHKKNQEKVLVHPISGHIEPGKLVALMGPSGSGKTTVLDMLAGKKTTPYSGNVFINGNIRGKLFPRLVSYVPQFDYGSGLETVWESVKFVSEMKAEYSDNQSKEIIEQERTSHLERLLAVLGLLHVKDSKIGDELTRGISGGQRRRVTLAKGLATGPCVVFGDEITSGLSATDSEQVMRALKNVCQYLDVTIFCVIHQPRFSVFSRFDHLILLTEGHCVYNGPVDEVEAHFAAHGYPVPRHVSPPDHFLDVITRGAPNANPDLFIQIYNEQIHPKIQAKVEWAKLNHGKSEREILRASVVKRGNKVIRLPWYQQLAKVSERGFRLMLRDVETLLVVIVGDLFLGLMIGVCYYNIRADPNKVQYQLAYIFTILITAALGAMANIPGLIMDRVIFQNERAEGLYGTAAYMISKVLTSLAISALGTLVLILGGHLLAGFSAETVPYVWLLSMVTYNAIDALVSVFVCISNGPQMANSLATIVITILTIFNGYTANLVSSPAFISWLNYLSPFFWSFWAAVNYLFQDYNFHGAQEPFTSYQSLLDNFGFQPNFQWVILGILVAYFAGCRAIQIVALKYFSTMKK